jgi:hypothetical protein
MFSHMECLLGIDGRDGNFVVGGPSAGAEGGYKRSTEVASNGVAVDLLLTS